MPSPIDAGRKARPRGQGTTDGAGCRGHVPRRPPVALVTGGQVCPPTCRRFYGRGDFSTSRRTIAFTTSYGGKRLEATPVRG